MKFGFDGMCVKRPVIEYGGGGGGGEKPYHTIVITLCQSTSRVSIYHVGEILVECETLSIHHKSAQWLKYGLRFVDVCSAHDCRIRHALCKD